MGFCLFDCLYPINVKTIRFWKILKIYDFFYNILLLFLFYPSNTSEEFPQIFQPWWLSSKNFLGISGESFLTKFDFWKFWKSTNCFLYYPVVIFVHTMYTKRNMFTFEIEDGREAPWKPSYYIFSVNYILSLDIFICIYIL